MAMRNERIEITRNLEDEPVVLACFDVGEEELEASAHAVRAMNAERFRTAEMSGDDVVAFRELTALADELADIALHPGLRTVVLRPARLQAYRHALAGSDLERTVELCRRALADGRLIAEEGTESSAVNQILYAMYLADLTDEAVVHVDAGVARAVALGSGWGFVASSGVRGAINYLAGNIVAAEADTRQALELPGCPPFAVPFVSAFLALTLVERGELEEAGAIV